MINSSQTASNYADELQRQIPLRILISALLTIFLYWGAKFGIYKSALLSATNLSIGWFIQNKILILDTPIHVYGFSIILGLVSHLLVKKFFFSYITFTQNRPAVLEKYQIISNNIGSISVDESSLAREYQFVHKATKKKADLAQILSLISIPFIAISFWGNSLDLLMGLLFFITAIYYLHFSCLEFVSSLIPLRLKLQGLMLRNKQLEQIQNP